MINHPVHGSEWTLTARVAVTLALLVSLSTLAAAQGERWAILIGVSAYNDPGIANLPYVSNDVQAMYEALTSPDGGFRADHVRKLTTDATDRTLLPTRINIVKRIKTLSQVVGPGDTVLLYFSGHGDTADGQGYLLPMDADTTDIPYSSVNLNKVHELLEAYGAAAVIEIIDACFSGVAAKGSGTCTDEFAKSVQPRAKAGGDTGPRGWITLASCAANQESYPLERGSAVGSSSAFTHFLTQGLRGAADEPPVGDGDGRLSIGEVSRYVEDRVKAWAAKSGVMQEPQFKQAGGADLASLVLLDLGGGPAVGLGRLRVTSVPSGAAIWLDDRDTGQVTPATVEDVRVGQHVVQLRLAGHARNTIGATVEAETTATAQATLSARVIYGEIAGRVMDEVGKPVVGASVVLAGVGATTTDAQGRYRFARVQQGDYKVKVTAEGYEAASATARQGRATDLRLRSSLREIQFSNETGVEVKLYLSWHDATHGWRSGQWVLAAGKSGYLAQDDVCIKADQIRHWGESADGAMVWRTTAKSEVVDVTVAAGAHRLVYRREDAVLVRPTTSTPTATPTTPAPTPPSSGKPWERPGTFAGQEIVGPGDIPLVWVPGGSFRMGSEDGKKDERPVHHVELSGFWIGKTEVTVEQWRSVMGRVAMSSIQGRGQSSAQDGVTWSEAKRFCDKSGLALPTEAQWEYAARGPNSRRYPWGDEWDNKKCLNMDNLGPGDVSSLFMIIGEFPSGMSWCGAWDMAGNVWEWCADRYGSDYYSLSPQKDPPGPGSGKCWVLRGGAWAGGEESCRSARRRHDSEESGTYGCGFRVASNCH